MTRYSIIIPPGAGSTRLFDVYSVDEILSSCSRGNFPRLWLVEGRWLSAAYAGAARCMQETVGVKQGRVEIIMILMES